MYLNKNLVALRIVIEFTYAIRKIVESIKIKEIRDSILKEYEKSEPIIFDVVNRRVFFEVLSNIRRMIEDFDVEFNKK